MRKKNGFTLIELLVTVALIALVVSAGAYFVIQIISNSKEKGKEISYESLRKIVLTYATEFRRDDIYWNIDSDTENTEYACTTVMALKNKGLIGTNDILYDKDGSTLNDTDYIMITRNDITNSFKTVLVDTTKCNDDFDAKVEFIPIGTIGNNNWYTKLNINYKISINDQSKIDKVEYYLEDNDKNLEKIDNNNILEKTVAITKDSKKIRLCLNIESRNGTNLNICDTNYYKLDGTSPTSPIITLSSTGDIIISGSTDNMTTPTNLGSTDNSTFTSDFITPPISSTIYAKAKDEAGNESSVVTKNFINENAQNGTASTNVETVGYKCNLDGKTYSTESQANTACKKTETASLITTSNTTYSCPAGYTCSGSSCTASSKCTKTTTGEVSEWYYCPHNGKYQKESTCSYQGEVAEVAYLKCNKVGTTTNSYSCCPSGSLYNGKCYLYSQYNCPSGWTKSISSNCKLSCSGPSNTQDLCSCQRTVTCNANGTQNLSCQCSDGSVLGGVNYCSQTQLYTCSKTASTCSYTVDVNKWAIIQGKYGNCRAAYDTGFSCSNGCTNNNCASSSWNKGGTLTCTVDGYNLSETRDVIKSCSNPIVKNGTNYCDTSEYWKTQTCNGDTSDGATTIYKRTCINSSPTKYYYCSLTGKYTTSSSCSSTDTKSVTATTTYKYSCPSGYTCSGSSCTASSTCSKVTTGTVSKVTKNHYVCSLFSTKEYSSLSEATTACKNHCSNSQAKYYSDKNKCLGLY